MNNTNVIDIEAGAVQHQNVGKRKVDVSRGEMRSEVSSQWFNRPDDEKFLDLTSLHNVVKARAENAVEGVIRPDEIEVIASQDDPDTLLLDHQDFDSPMRPSHWSFGQSCGLVKAPAGYLRNLPAPLAAMNLQYGLMNHRSENIKFLNSGSDIMAATGADYGRVFDHEVVEAVMKIAGNGTGENGWKIPAVMDWQTGAYDPDAPITRDSSTLFASDRDVFMFLVDDRNPIEIGKLQSGEPDLLFRGFYVWNSEVGSKSLGIATMYLRGVCQNRCLWGVEGYSQVKLRHSKNAPQRFTYEATPVLENFTNNNTRALLDGVAAAKGAKVADSDDEAMAFLQGRKGGNFTKAQAAKIINRVMDEENVRPRSVWDMVQGITAVARDEGYQENRVAMERVAGKLLDKVA